MKRVLAILTATLLAIAGEQVLNAQNEHKALIVPVKFNDLQITTSAETLDSLAVELSKYYNAQFRDSIKFVFDVSKVVPVSGSYATFGANQSFRRDAQAHKMALAVYKSLYDQIDFSIYDNDNDGFVNDIIILTPGIPESSGGGENQFWPQYIELENKDIPFSLRIRLKGFAIAPEMNADGGTIGIGILAHEFGHILGLKDMYDTDDDASGGLYPGLGITSLMDNGLENDSGNTPPNLNAIEREILGTGHPEVLEAGSIYSLEPINLNGRYFKIPTTVSNRYYLIENRSAVGNDAHIGGSGMMIYKVNKSETDAGYSSYFQRTITAQERWKQNQVNCNPEYPCAELVASFWPKEGQTIFNSGKIALTNIHKEANGNISFNAIEPVSIIEKMVYQTSATFIWVVSSEPGQIDSCKFEWAALNAPANRRDGILSNDGSYTNTITGLSPHTTYNYKASVYYSDGSSYSSSGSFITKNYRKGLSRFIYLGDAVRNRDGSFQAGSAIPLIVYNSVDEPVSWSFNGKAISVGPDGFWKIPGDGTLKVEITNSDGTKDVIIKEIRVR